MNVRTVKNVHVPEKVSDGAGVRLLRAIATPELNMLDPFLLLDEFRSDQPDDYIGGFPSHPHRGFETVTYMLAGAMRHEDSTGQSGELIGGGAQWMTAGRGVIHSEMPRQEQGLLWGFQLWVNLPASEKMRAPRYQDIAPEQIPIVTNNGDGTIRVIAGEIDGVIGPVQGIVTDPLYLDVTLAADETVKIAVAADHNVFAYVIDGHVAFAESKTITSSRLVTFNEGDTVVATAGESGGRFLLVAAVPINEPVARGGPFVMNTPEEILTAFDDYQKGQLV